MLSDDVRLRIARTIARRAELLGDEALATTWHSKVLERAPDDGEVLLALERLYRRADDKPALLDILQRRADLAYDDPAIEAPAAPADRHPGAGPGTQATTPSRPTSGCWR